MNIPLKLSVESKIYIIRGQKVMLDYDLALLYGVETRILNQAVRRNIERFPDDFMFQLTEIEWDFLISQIVISKSVRGGRQKLPLVFSQFKTVFAAIRELMSNHVVPRKRIIGLGESND